MPHTSNRSTDEQIAHMTVPQLFTEIGIERDRADEWKRRFEEAAARGDEDAARLISLHQRAMLAEARCAEAWDEGVLAACSNDDIVNPYREVTS